MTAGSPVSTEAIPLRAEEIWCRAFGVRAAAAVESLPNWLRTEPNFCKMLRTEFNGPVMDLMLPRWENSRAMPLMALTMAGAFAYRSRR